MTDQELIQAQDAALAVDSHYSERGAHWNPMTPEEICREQNERMPRGVRETTFGTQPIDRMLSQATPRPHVKSGLSRGMQRNLAIVVVVIVGLLAVAVLS